MSLSLVDEIGVRGERKRGRGLTPTGPFRARIDSLRLMRSDVHEQVLAQLQGEPGAVVGGWRRKAFIIQKRNCMIIVLTRGRSGVYHTEMGPYDKNGVSLMPLQVRTAYAEALDALEDLHLTNLTSDLASVSLHVKTVSGRRYVYAQGRIADGSARQVCVGPFDARTEALLERYNRLKEDAERRLRHVGSIARMLRAAGVGSLDPVEWRVVAALAADGVFRVGGVLVGTVALRCIAGLIGVRLKVATALTADVDIAGSSASFVEAVTGTALERLDMGFSPMLDADAALFGSRFTTRNGDFKVEFLTPLVGRQHRRRTEIRQMGVTAVPLRFLDYLIEEPVSAIALGRRPVLVRVPDAARYAVHKLIVSRERKRSSPKILKDLEQSHALQSALARLDPEGLDEAFEIARKRGPGWKRRVDAGQKAMIRVHGEPG
jgi:hypothetical protein